jgi:hypothetical protein
MTYVFVHDIAAIDPIPQGLILHLAGPTDEGFRIIGIWESEAAWQLFQIQRLQPAIAALGGPSRPQSSFRDLHPAHVITGCSDQHATKPSHPVDRQPGSAGQGDQHEPQHHNEASMTDLFAYHIAKQQTADLRGEQHGN